MILILLLSSILHASAPDFGQFNKGCPLNSQCDEKVGQLWKNWSDLLKKDWGPKKLKDLKSFVKGHGIPFKAWMEENKMIKEPHIIWDSHCKNHRPPNTNILLSDVFLKKIKDDVGVLFNKAFIVHKSGKSSLYSIPRDQTPVLIKNKNLVFSMEEEGDYYGLHISNGGALTLSKPVTKTKEITEITCPVSLVDNFKSLKYPSNLYSDIFCQQIWNEDEKSYSIVLMGWSCS